MLISILAAAKLIALHGPVIWFAREAARRLAGDEGALDRGVAGMTVYFLAIAASAWVLPRMGYEWFVGYALALGAAGVYLNRTYKHAPATGPGNIPVLTLTAAVAIALVTFALLALALARPSFEHDPLTYQLYFASSWLQSGKLAIIPTPFGDPSQAYGPANASVYYAWLMAPLSSDLLAQAGAWPFLILALLACSGLARELGAPSQYSFAGAAFCLTAPLLVYEGRTALSDLPGAAAFASALFFFLKAVRRGRGADVFLALGAAGLMIGTKYTMAPLAVFLVPPALAAAWRSREKQAWLGWALGLLAACGVGVIWYARNFSLTGNPVFPLRVAAGGHTIFAGLYGREQMAGWAYDYAGFGAWLQAMQTSLSLGLLVAGFAAGPVAAAIYIRTMFAKTTPTGAEIVAGTRLRAAVAAFVALIPLLIDRVIWHVFPFQVYRFWLPAWPVMAAVLAAYCSRRPAAVYIVLPAAWGGLAVPGPFPELTDGMARWLLFTLPAAAAVALAGTAGLAWWLKKHERPLDPGRLVSPVTALVLALVVMVAVVFAMRGYDGRRARALALWGYGAGWERLPRLEVGLSVAYTGANVLYPLAGPELANRVAYVDTAGRVMPRDDEAARELMVHPEFQTPEPMVGQLSLCPRAWARAMAGFDYLFVMKVGMIVTLNAAHDKAGWPVEDGWARAAPGLFELTYGDGASRIYKINRDRIARADSLPAGCMPRPPDAVAVCRSGASECGQFFPLAPAAMRAMDLGAPKRAMQ